MNRGAVLLMALALGGCLRAKFIDERPDLPDLLPRADLVSSADLTGEDATGANLSDQDASDDALSIERPIASGTFESRAGHAASGNATLVDLGNGQVELRFGSNFSVVNVPGPFVYLSSRSTLFNAQQGKIVIDPATDLYLGPLGPYSGARSYPVPGGDGGRRYAWVYCQPYNVEVGVAALAP